MIEMKVVLEIDEVGDVHGLYTDCVDLFSIGRITNVRKTSNVEFNERSQCWEILSLDGEVLYTDTSREVAIQKEIELFSPGGEQCIL